MRERLQKKSNHTLKKLLVTGCILCIVVVIGYAVVTSQFRLKTIIIEGSDRYTETQMKEHLLTKKTDQITLLMYLRYQFIDLPKLPFIEKMNLELKDKNTIVVEMYEKMIVGCISMKDSYMYFDKDGIVVESSKDKIDGVPLIEGLKFDKIILYESINIQKNELFTMILNLTQSIHKNELKVDKAVVNSDNEVTLFCEGNEVLLGKRDYYDLQLAAVKSAMKSSENRRLSYDLRYYNENNTKITAKPLN